MKTMKKIAALLVLALVFAPVFYVFNENDEVWINLLGFAYFGFLYKFGRRIAPKFILDYLDEK